MIKTRTLSAACLLLLYAAGYGYAEYPVKRLTANPALDAISAWSPDGKTIAFQSNRNGDYDIYTIPASGGNETRLTFWAQDQGQPSYSPDGRYIAFTWRVTPYQDEDVCIMPATGGSYINFSNNSAYDALPAWSPDGDNIAYVSDRFEETWDEVWVQPYPSGVAWKLTTGLDDQCPAYSPDGSEIAYHVWVTPSSYDVDIFRTPANGGGVPFNVTQTHNIEEFKPTWSPDGQYIAYYRMDPADGNYDIYMIPSWGGTAIRLTDNAAFDYAPAWSPDGTKIAFTSNRNDNNYDIYLLCLVDAVEPASLGKIKALFR